MRNFYILIFIIILSTNSSATVKESIIKNLETGLKKIGFSDEETNKILGNNWFNFYKGIN